MHQHFLVDAWREMHPSQRRYTWHGRINFASRIDFILISSCLLSRIVKTDIIATTISDHSALFLEIDLVDEKRGKGFWKFNESFLKNNEFCELIEKSIDEVLVKNVSENLDPLMNWEMIKNQVIGESIRFSVIKARDKNRRIQELNYAIDQLEADLDSCLPGDVSGAELQAQLINAKHELDTILIDNTAKIIRNTKSRWYNEGEANTKYFFNLEKQRAIGTCMSKLELDDGSVLTERKKILKEQKRFYEQVYTSDPDVQFTLHNASANYVLSEDESNELEMPFTDQEVYNSLSSMETGKTPGTDGLGPAFYITFWDKLKHSLISAYNYAFEHGILHSSARRGILSLIPKKDRNLLKIKNWRPITLLNTDYKILSKTIANRIKKNLPALISHDQTGFMKGRNIKYSENFRY